MTVRTLLSVVGGLLLVGFGGLVLSFIPYLWGTANELAAHGATDGENAMKLYLIGGMATGVALTGFGLFFVYRPFALTPHRQ